MENKLKERLEQIISESPVKPTFAEMILSLMTKAYYMDKPEPLTGGWINFENPITPYTGEYEVKDDDGNVFIAYYVDFGEDRGWQCDEYIVAYREIPQKPGKEGQV